ncbi:MAG TPA: hypothetical protein VF627_12680 [Abditibacterium sp.]
MKPSSEASWPQARRGAGRVALATTLFALWHSFLCWQNTKNFVKTHLGERRGTHGYRAFFMAQSLVTTVTLAVFILKQPHRTLYNARGWRKIAAWSVQGAALLVAGWAIASLDTGKFLGLKGLRAIVSGENLSEAQAQGPELESGVFQARGPYGWSRHPLEWVPPILLFSTPKMKTNWLPFDILTALYCFVGALHEEKRLLDQHPEAFAEYQEKVSFWVRKPKRD